MKQFSITTVSAVLMGAAFTTTTVYTGADWKDSCRDAGYEDGQNESFSQGHMTIVGKSKVAMTLTMVSLTVAKPLEGNARDVCESATDWLVTVI